MVHPRALLVAHPEAMAAEALATALERFPALVPVAVVTSASAAEAYAARIDVAVVDHRLDGCCELARALRRRGVRVVMIGNEDEDAFGLSIAPGAPVHQLAAALVPGSTTPMMGRAALSDREHQVLALAGRGFVAKEIARHLGISSKTVEQHKSRACRKLGVPNQAAAISLIASVARGDSSPLQIPISAA